MWGGGDRGRGRVCDVWLVLWLFYVCDFCLASLCWTADAQQPLKTNNNTAGGARRWRSRRTRSSRTTTRRSPAVSVSHLSSSWGRRGGGSRGNREEEEGGRDLIRLRSGTPRRGGGSRARGRGWGGEKRSPCVCAVMCMHVPREGRERCEASEPTIKERAQFCWFVYSWRGEESRFIAN